MPQPGDGREWTEHWRGQRALSLFTAVAYFMCSSYQREEQPTKTGVGTATEVFAVPLGQRTHVQGRKKVLRALCPNWTMRQFLTWNKGSSHAAVASWLHYTNSLHMHRVVTPEYETHQVIAEQRHHCPHQKGITVPIIFSVLITANIMVTNMPL